MTTRPEDIVRAHIEALEEELRAMPHSPWHAQKRADRERALAMYKADLERRERIHERFIAGRAELLARCDRFPDVRRD